jgi:uncharacterized protein YndB with AHSA1/START domain
MKKGDSVRVTTFVDVEPEEAFEVFTAEIDRWWKKGPRYRSGSISFEERVRLIEAQPGGEIFEVGRVLIWEPAARLVFEWRGRNFSPGEITEVEVLFEAQEDGTRVTLEHRGWSKIPAKHPVRHGLEGEAFQAMIGMWWGDLMTAFRAHRR